MPNRLSEEEIQCKIVKSEYWRDSIHKSVNKLVHVLVINSKKYLFTFLCQGVPYCVMLHLMISLIYKTLSRWEEMKMAMTRLIIQGR